MTLLSAQQNAIENEEEVLSLRRQLQTLKERYQSLQKLGQPDNEQISMQRRFHELSIENEHCRQQIEKLTHAAGEREKKVAELQRAGTGLSEKLLKYQHSQQQLQEALTQERHLKQEASDEVAALHGQFAALKAKFIALQQQGQQEANEKLSLLDGREQLRRERDQAVQDLVQANERIDGLQKIYAAAENNLQAREGERQQLLADSAKAKTAQDEAEARLKFAHFHLAKKVREATEFGDKIQALESRLREYEDELQEAKAQSSALQSSLEEHSQQQERSHAQWQESINSAEAMVAGWEEKYSALQRKWQESDARLKEAIRMEERYRQMQKMWKNLNDVFNEAPEGQMKDVQMPADNHAPTFERKVETESLSLKRYDMHRPYQNLFDMPKSHDKRFE